MRQRDRAAVAHLAVRPELARRPVGQGAQRIRLGQGGVPFVLHADQGLGEGRHPRGPLALPASVEPADLPHRAERARLGRGFFGRFRLVEAVEREVDGLLREEGGGQLARRGPGLFGAGHDREERRPVEVVVASEL